MLSTGMKAVCQLEKKCNSHVLREGARWGTANTAEKKVTNTASPQKKS